MDPKKNIINLNSKFSTTKKLTREKPSLEQKFEDLFKTTLFLSQTEGRKGEGGLRTQGYFKKNFLEQPLVTVITVVFNGEKHIEQTIKSVLIQDYENIEYIIIDGKSVDKTVDLIKKYEPYVDYWVSEPDQGLYNAMNKGISLSQGQIIGIINVGDWYESDAIRKSVEVLQEEKLKFSYGTANLVKEDGSKLGMVLPIERRIQSRIYMETPFAHPTVFIKKNVFQKLGLFDTRYKMAADHELWLRMYTQNYKGVNTHQIIANIRPSGVSSNLDCIRESRDIAIKYGKNRIHAYFQCSQFIINRYLASFLPQKIVAIIKKMKKSRYQLEIW